MRWVTVMMLILGFAAGGIAVEGRAETTSGDPVTEKARVSYSVGYQIGEDFVEQGSDIDAGAFMAGVRDALAGTSARVAPDRMRTLLVGMKKKLVTRQRFEKQEMLEQRHAAAQRFFEDNAKKKDVVVLSSGVQYRVIREGTGKRPAGNDRVEVVYTSRLLDGRPIGSSQARGGAQTFYVNAVIGGLSEALRLMKEGAHWEIFVPPELAYKKRRGFLENRAVIFDLELVSTAPAE